MRRRTGKRTRILLPLFLVAVLAAGCAEQASELTKRNLQEALCPEGHQFRYTHGDTQWVSWRILRIEQESPVYAEVMVQEKGLQKIPSWRVRGSLPRYKDRSRRALYELRRNSADGRWYVDTSEGTIVRRLWFLKRRFDVKPAGPPAEPKASPPEAEGSW